MDLTFSPEEEIFRGEVQAFLRERLPSRISDKVRAGQRLCKGDYEEWHAILNARGWLAPHWPAQHGGSGWSVGQTSIFGLESARGHAPQVIPFGLSMLGPVLIKYGSKDQQNYWLPRILDGTDWWCQGFSEPGAGSDLASIKTSAVRDGDHYIVNGQKTWTTLGQFANMIFCLVRTSSSGKRQEGISFLMIDMNTPGVEVRPIILLDGEHEVNEIFFTDVRVPVTNLVGEEDKGWTYAKFLLTYERTNIAGVGMAVAALENLKRIAALRRKKRQPLARDHHFASRLARVEIDLENMRTTDLRVLAAAGHGSAPAAESSMLKIRGTEIRQELASLTRRALGPYARPFISEALDAGFNGEPIGPSGSAAVTAQYLNDRKLSIYGGSNEVQRDIIAKAILEL